MSSRFGFTRGMSRFRFQLSSARNSRALLCLSCQSDGPIPKNTDELAHGMHLLYRGGITMEDDNRLSYFFLGLGLGVAVGVLFAPKAGAETRDLIRSKANEGADFAKRRANEVKKQAADALERV